ncbi:MAG: PLDc N-terminal domain-containing protein [Pseudomonadota bacterium]
MQPTLTLSPELLVPILVLAVIDLVGRLVALVQAVRAERTHGPRVVWVAAILLVGFGGWISWFIFGRSQD